MTKSSTVARRISRVAVGAAVVLTSVIGTTAVAAADPPVVPHVPPIVGTFHVNPSEGPVGTKTTWTGFCGFPAHDVSYGLNLPEVGTVNLGGIQVPIASTPFGKFSVQMQIPAVGNVGVGPGAHWVFQPGTYYAGVICDLGRPTEVFLPYDTFVVTSSPR